VYIARCNRLATQRAEVHPRRPKIGELLKANRHMIPVPVLVVETIKRINRLASTKLLAQMQPKEACNENDHDNDADYVKYVHFTAPFRDLMR
jgi:hypothetical protein